MCCPFTLNSHHHAPTAAAAMQGVDCGEITLLLHVRPCEGLVRQVSPATIVPLSLSRLSFRLALAVLLGGWGFRRLMLIK